MGKLRDHADVVVVGAGIAGTSLAYFLSRRGVSDVLVVEREQQPACHASGRSAATLVELDPNPTVQALKMIGARFLQAVPEEFAEHTILEERGLLALFREPEWSAVRQAAPFLTREGMPLDLLSPREASERAGGVLLPEAFAGAAWVARDGFLDVHELLSSYMRHARRGGTRFLFSTEVLGLVVDNGRCVGVRTAGGCIDAGRVVNAAGAWVAQVAADSGALPIAFTPRRRTLVILPPPEGADLRRWPLVWSDTHAVYFRPEATGLLFCPMDEAAMEPCDPAVDDTVIAAGLERLRVLAPSLVPRTLGRRWAGLRTFAPDGVPVVGPDPCLPGFFWLAGQGGCGIETSPALGQIAADLLVAGRSGCFDTGLLAPERFAH